MIGKPVALLIVLCVATWLTGRAALARDVPLPMRIPFAATALLLGVFTTALAGCTLLGVLGWFGRRQTVPVGGTVVGLFHPYCNAGGGGERVLWVGIRALQLKYPAVHCVVYTGDDASALRNGGADILERAKKSFGVTLPRPVDFVGLRSRWLVEASTWPHFTLIMQSLGSVVLGAEALARCLPDVYVDTMGYAFTLPLFHYVGARVGCYVHYPTISTDMLSRVRNREQSYNNNETISKSAVLSSAKLLYYQLFAHIYGRVGRYGEQIMVNSSWTHGHIDAIWRAPQRTFTVFPPCDTTTLQKIPLSGKGKRTHLIVSVSQFRPEKDQALQIRSFARFVKQHPEYDEARLRLVGSCRHADDFARVEELRALASTLGVSERVEFTVNVSYAELQESLGSARVGLHTMWNEHFGIGVVEFLAAGAVCVAHNSGGPQRDIVTAHKGRPTGFLAATETEYADALARVFALDAVEYRCVQESARESVSVRFGEQAFSEAFVKHVALLMN